MKTDGSRALGWVVVAVVVAVLGCDEVGMNERTAADGPADGPGSVFGGAEVVATAADTDSEDDDEPDARPRRIYYDLTAYDWYRHGEPLRVGGGEYAPEGKPRAIPAGEMQRVATYEGVDVYVPDGAQPPHDVVFVPVFGRYWQPFVLQARVPTRAD